MPDSPEADLKLIEKHASEEIAQFGGTVGKVEIEPVAFGLKAVKLMFIMDEDKGSTEDLENKISQQQHVESINVVDVRRTIG